MAWSLRSRVMLGAALWTVGLSLIAGVALTTAMLRYPRAPIVFHHVFFHAIALSLVALGCLVAGLAQVRRGLSPINRLRTRLSAVHVGSERRVEGAYPSEVQPLVTDLNALLEHRERTVERALARAGDLAHGLKTPLAVLAHEADRADGAGLHDLAAGIREQIEHMRRQVDYQLARTRAVASGATPGARCAVRESVDALSRTLLRLHAGRGLAIEVDVAPEHVVRAQREDLDEILGNLLDNACKWTRSRVRVASASADGAVVVDIDDDGPGLEPAMSDRVLQRGVRADEAAPGSGLGLAIARELVEVYGGSIGLARSPMGGLRATVRLPAASPV